MSTFIKILSVFALSSFNIFLDESAPLFFFSTSLGILSPLLVNGFFGFVSYNNLSLLFMILSLVVTLISIISFFHAGKTPNNPSNMFKIWYFLSFLVLVCFILVSFFAFYVFLEVVFLTMFYFLVSCGVKSERKLSSYYMFFFTILSSLPLLVFLVTWQEQHMNSCFHSFLQWPSFWGFFLIMVFLVKIPIFGVHIWLPKAHVEAPLVGSILLSGSLLKIGLYGMVRFSEVMKNFFYHMSSYFMVIGLTGALISSMICLRQLDIKSMVAYSSVVHMGLAFSGMISFTTTGLKSSLYESLSHSLSSPLMFYTTYLLYKLTNSRSTVLSKGSGSFLMFYATLLVVLASLGVPPLISFFSEFMGYTSVLMYSQDLFILVIVLIFCSSFYLIYFLLHFFHGVQVNYTIKMIMQPDLHSVHFMLFFFLCVPLWCNNIF